MLTILDVLLNGMVALFIVPLALISLATGSKPPQGSVFSKLYTTEPWLMVLGNIFLLTLGATAFTKLARHFDLLSAAGYERVSAWVEPLFLVMLVIFLVFLVRAWLKVRRASRAQS